MSNRLAKENSPYLLQHANNPVDWYPWGEEALTKARAEDKPILLSIGYSACHWCHVMEHECFENAEIAKLMNDRFVNIKVDREERPDLDQIYQNVAMAITRGGGWPLTVFLTPDLRPFFGGTYFPPEDRWGRPGFPRVLSALAEAYQSEPENISQNAEKLMNYIQHAESHSLGGAGELPKFEDVLEAARVIISQMDWENGGIGGAPKFPNAMVMSLLWRLGKKDENLEKAALLTLNKMASGGIYDQLGGGFHRYSVDERWSIPHFEKMLYDNGLLLKVYAEVLMSAESRNLTSEDRLLFTAVLKESVSYLLREMRSSEGGFYAAQDADSEGEEGKYFAWTPELLSEACASGLTENEAKVFGLHYGVTTAGNFEHGMTIPYRAIELSQVAAKVGVELQEAVHLLKLAREKLLKIRRKRVAPATDRKIITSWNGLIISGLAWAGQALDAEGKGAKNAARDAYSYAMKNLLREDGRLWSVAAPGAQGKLNAYLDDYAFMAAAALDLARISETGTEADSYIRQARTWVDIILKYFTCESGGYYFTSDDHEALIQRPKTIFDQAIPSGTAVTLGCLSALAEIDAEGSGEKYSNEFHKQMGLLFSIARKSPYGSGELLCAALMEIRGPVVVSGVGVGALFRGANVFQKGSSGHSGILVCHRKACSLPFKDVSEAAKEVAARVPG